ncbi:GntR family transcriptional regulator [Pseudomonas putida]|uniref:GntR family transcriptional regulator n=1 Tax=Pseudomonas putida TaxID=303 RepID=UPI0007B6C8C2|nr:GntR family transcriptional regulator [Pseudomonas putida]ANC04034.1 GntR family transcriptional regulator [Pseudomonas putida]
MDKQPVNQSQEVESRLREMILNLDLGPGERLTERWAEAQFGSSRTPVRAALLRLMGEGLVAREGRGWIVTPLDAKEIEQLFVFREVLEAASLKLASNQITESVLNELEEAYCKPKSSLMTGEAHKIGTDFHMRLAELSGNDFIYRGIADAMTRLARARWLDTEADHDGWEQHLAIVVALRAGNVDLAASHLVTHISESKCRLLEILKNTRRSIRARGGLVMA